jgi:transcriptional regulator of aromatic amino acid metabolism
VLLIGSSGFTDGALISLLEASCAPVWRCDGSQFALPPDDVGTVVLENPAALAASAQRDLFRWVTDHPSVRMITVTASPLYPLVQAGRFLDDLYYWLNVVTIPD